MSSISRIFGSNIASIDELTDGNASRLTPTAQPMSDAGLQSIVAHVAAVANTTLDPTAGLAMRPAGRNEQAALNRLDTLAAQAEQSGDTDLAQGLRAAKQELSAQIAALGKGKEDVGVNVAINAVLNISNPQFANDRTTAITDKNNVSVSIGGNDTAKCNIFVAQTYALGAGLNFKANGAQGRGFPLLDGKPPAANWLGDARDRQHLSNLSVVKDGSLKPGDIVAWRTKGGKGDGHSSVYIGGGLVVYAGGEASHGAPQAKPLSLINDALAGSRFFGLFQGGHDTYVVRRYSGK